jgi:desulfoferrodoxin (superoxide reductase-like protein)
MDSLGAHMYICREQGKNEIRNPDHARLTAVLRRLCQSHSSQISLSVGLGEPHCKESSFHIQWIYQQIAVRIQTSRAQNVEELIG